MENPFKYGEVVSGENFCNREKELKEINRAIANGDSFWMYSPRRFGKSSLILMSLMDRLLIRDEKNTKKGKQRQYQLMKCIKTWVYDVGNQIFTRC